MTTNKEGILVKKCSQDCEFFNAVIIQT